MRINIKSRVENLHVINSEAAYLSHFRYCSIFFNSNRGDNNQNIHRYIYVWLGLLVGLVVPYRIASKQGLELDDLLPLLESRELLGIIQVQSGDVSITEKGYLLLAASPKGRKKILRDILIKFDVFRKLIDMVKK